MLFFIIGFIGGAMVYNLLFKVDQPLSGVDLSKIEPSKPSPTASEIADNMLEKMRRG